MAKIDLNVRILRYQPGKDDQPHWQDFAISVEDESTVLDVLNEIHWRHDGTLAYRRSCRSSICGSCAMKVNGRNVLACETPIHRFGTKLKIEPLSGFEILKDLVVDLEPFFAKLKRIKPYLILDKPLPDKEFVQSQQQLEQIGESTLCILCAACSAACPSSWPNGDYLGPAALLKAYRFVFDSRDDGADQRLEIVNDKNGVWRCHTIFNCMEACPKKIKITEYLSRLKVKVVENSI